MFKTRVYCVGLSHHHTPIAVREQLRFSISDLKEQLRVSSMQRIGGDAFAGVREMVLLSTCNRVELYSSIDTRVSDPGGIMFDLTQGACHRARRDAGWECGVVEPEEMADNLRESMYQLEDARVVEHLLAVACGLDSMVLGETQILTQVNEARDSAQSAGTLGEELEAIFRAARRAGKRARTETSIGRNAASVGAIAVALASDRLGGLHGRDVTVIGTGEMGRLALKVLLALGVGRLRIVNRSHDRARFIAEEIRRDHDIFCKAYGFDDLGEVLLKTDAVITATSAKSWIINAGQIRYAATRRVGREQVLVDIAVPRDIEPVAGEIEGVTLFDFDGIRGARDEALEARRREIPRVEAIINEEVKCVRLTLRKLWSKPLIRSLRRKAEAIRQQELQRTYRLLDSPDPETWSHVQHMTRVLVNKLFHDPTARIEEAVSKEGSDTYAEEIRHLFGLEDTSSRRRD